MVQINFLIGDLYTEGSQSTHNDGVGGFFYAFIEHAVGGAKVADAGQKAVVV